MKVLVLGSGMYVTGRGGLGNATVLSALAQVSRVLPVQEVLVVARDPANAGQVAAAAARINDLLGSQLEVTYRPTIGKDLEAETAALCESEHLDCAVVCTPDHLHAAPLRALLRAGVPSLVVKPFTPTLKEALELVELQRQTGTYGAVEFHKRWDETNLYTKQLVAEGQLGRLLYVSVDYSQRIQIPSQVFRGWVERTNIFQYLGVHYVDLIYFLTGFLPLQLTAYGTRGVLEARGIDTFDSVHVMIEWGNSQDSQDRFLSQLNTNWIDPDCTSAMSDQRFKIVGSTGRLECDQKNRGIELVREGMGVIHPNPYFSDFLPGLDGGLVFQGYGYKSIAQFVHDAIELRQGATSLEELGLHRPGFRQALVSTAVIDAVNRSLTMPLAWRKIHDLPG